MLMLTRKVGRYVDLENMRTRALLRVTLKSLDEGVAEIEVSDPVKRELLNVWRLEPGRDFDCGDTTVTYSRPDGHGQARLGFDAPDHIAIRRDDIKSAKPQQGKEAA